MAETISLVVVVASVWVLIGYGVPALFPTRRWSDLKRFFKRHRSKQ